MSADPPPDMSGHPPTRRHFLRHVQFNHLIVKLSDAKMISQTSLTLLRLFVMISESHQSLIYPAIFNRYSLWLPQCSMVPSDRTATGRIEKY